MSLIIDAQGLTVSVDGDTIAQVVSFTGVDGEAPDIDVTHLGSVSYKEFLVGLPVDGAFNMNLIYDPDDTGQATLKTVSEARSTVEFIVTYPSGHTLTFDAYVKSLDFGKGQVDSRIDRVCNCMIVGEAVFEAPAP